MKLTPNTVSWLHRLAAAEAMVAFASIVVGTFARSSFVMSSRHGAPPATPYQEGYGALVLATVVGAVLLAAWLWRSRAQYYVKLLGTITAGVAMLQGVASGSSSFGLQTPSAAAAHAFLGIAVFSLSLCLALFTRTDWRWNETLVADVSAPSLRSLLAFSTAVIFVESILGACLSSRIIGTPPHVWTGLVATFLSLWVLEVALNKFSQVPAVKIPSILLAEAVVLQLFVGLVAHSMELNGRVSPQPLPGLPVINATHAAAGALAVAASLFATIQAFKYLAPVAPVRAATAAVAARERELRPAAATEDSFDIESERPLNPERGD